MDQPPDDDEVAGKDDGNADQAQFLGDDGEDVVRLCGNQIAELLNGVAQTDTQDRALGNAQQGIEDLSGGVVGIAGMVDRLEAGGDVSQSDALQEFLSGLISSQIQSSLKTREI